MQSENPLSNYYLLNPNKLNEVLDTTSYDVFMSAYNLSTKNSITSLKRQADNHQVSIQTGLHIKQIPLALENAHQLLYSHRSQNQLPRIVKTISLATNANLFTTFYQAARLFNRNDFSLLADAALDEIMEFKNPDQEPTVIESFCLIRALITRLQYQWCDVSFDWLFQFALKLIHNLPNYSELLPSNQSVGCSNETIINDLHNLYFLSSEAIFLKTATQLINDLINQTCQSSNNKHQRLLIMAVTSFKPNFILIRGENFQVTDWLQKLSTEFKPNQFVYGIGNNYNGPDHHKLPSHTQPKACVYKLSGSCEEFISIDRLLNHLA
ncbi:MAG: hypothetical protein COA74_07325 [Gammaproteobacteria bacterium]|nr:MAG: hypothetical protein COA74_07325 [Gammaproteobacteria bacterium]